MKLIGQRLQIEPMRPEDVPVVLQIESISFSTAWPANAFSNELSENKLAHYFVGRIDGARCVHPADFVVEALVDEELSPCRRAVRVQASLAHHLELGPEVERRVRIDQEERMVADRVGRRLEQEDAVETIGEGDRPAEADAHGVALNQIGGAS